MKGNETVFRRRMVERLAAADEMTEPVRLDPLRSWPLIVTVLLVLVAAAGWAWQWSSPVIVEGSGVIRLGSDPSETPRAVLYSTFDPELRPGRPVRLRTAFGDSPILLGAVVEVSAEAHVRETMASHLEDPDLARRLYDEGRRRRVLVELEPFEGRGVQDRRQVEAEIEIGRRRPVDELFPDVSSDKSHGEPDRGSSSTLARPLLTKERLQ